MKMLGVALFLLIVFGLIWLDIWLTEWLEKLKFWRE